MRDRSARGSTLPTPARRERGACDFSTVRRWRSISARLGYRRSRSAHRCCGCLSCPHGIILVTGPTGSGKTTTLYAALRDLNTAERKILTVEDPIEYQIDGINQIQVQPQIGLDFAAGAALASCARTRTSSWSAKSATSRPRDIADAGGADRPSGAVDPAHQ